VSEPPPPRVSSGNPQLDAILNGGFVAQRPYLVVGPVGTGKTKLALQFLCEGARHGENVLLVTLEEPPNELRLNHPALLPDLDRVNVLDAIPDVMRYEPVPHTDIAEARRAVPFSEVGERLRKSPELTSVVVSFTALEQMLKNEFVRQSFTRVVIDSLTAMEYFNMKGSDETVGAQTFLRLLADLGATTLLTVETPVEESETVARRLARGSIRLFRWDHEGRTVRAIAVEKFRGSAYDLRLHPYDVSPRGLEIDLETTVERPVPSAGPTAPSAPSVGRSSPTHLAPAIEIVRLVAEINYLAALGGDPASAREELEHARTAHREHRTDLVPHHVDRARTIVQEQLAELNLSPPNASAEPPPPSGEGARPMARVSMGNAGIDQALGGGLIPGRPYLVTGGPGAGKTLLGLTFLAEGLRLGENVLLVAVDEPPSEILENFRSIGWDLSRVQVLDANPGTRVIRGKGDAQPGRALSDLHSMAELSDEGPRAAAGGEITLQAIHSKLRQGMGRKYYARVVVDSITAIRKLAQGNTGDLQARRSEVQSLLRFLSEKGATTLVTATTGDPLALTPEEILTRGEIQLSRAWVGDRSIRFLKVVRLRGSAHDPEWRPFAITSSGIFCD
jgi:KaiC/GvpD/RAD55 family RecA-like ATPase